MSNLNYNYGKSVVQKLQVTSGATTGYVLTSDSSGNALWQTPTIFTGNTSGDCITDLYVTNVYGCSPIIIHDSINSYGSSAIGINAFAFGNNTTANGDYSHAEGNNTIAFSPASHAEGGYTTATGYNSHAEGYGTTASGDNSHTEGYNTIANSNSAHAEGSFTKAIGTNSHAEGYYTTANGGNSHAEGYYTTASGSYSHSEGNLTIANGNTSHAEGNSTTASGVISHAEGSQTTATGNYSHAEGESTKAIGSHSHTEGFGTTTNGSYSHAGGINAIATGISSFIHSSGSTVTGARSAVIGGRGITGTTNDTVYVPFFNIKYIGSGTSTINLGLDALGNVVTGTTGSYGVFGISNSSGLYTYYTTLTLAMAAAVSGQVIEMFADVLETGAVSITLKNGVNINGNGHTYTLSNASATTTLIDNGVAVTCSIFNITFKTLNITETTYILKITGASKINGNESTNFISTVNRGVSINNVNAEVSGVFSSGTRGADIDSGTLTDSTLEATFIGAYVGGTGKLIKCISRLLSSGGNSAIYNDGSIYECSAYSPITAIRGGYIYKCLGVSTGSFGIGSAYLVMDSTAYSSGSAAIYLVNEIINSSGYSTAGVGIVLPSSTMTSCVGYSTASNGIATTTSSGGASFIWNSYAYSSGAAAISQTNNNTLYGTSQISNCTIICSWDNVGGHAIAAAGATNIANCTMRVLNASAKAIYSAAAITLKYSNNSFEGSTNPISATITQGIINTFDNKGNILI